MPGEVDDEFDEGMAEIPEQTRLAAHAEPPAE